MNKYTHALSAFVSSLQINDVKDAWAAMNAMATGAACMADTINSLVGNETTEQQNSEIVIKRLDNIDTLFCAVGWVSTNLPFDNSDDALFRYLDAVSSAAATKFMLGCQDDADIAAQSVHLIRGSVMALVNLTMAPLVIKHWETLSDELKVSITEDFVGTYSEAIERLSLKWGDFLLARSCTPNPHIKGRE